MFDTLDMIDRVNLRKAFGTAVAIPVVLCNLASPAEELAFAALQTL